MKKILWVIAMTLIAAAVSAQEFNRIPRAWKWTGDKEVLFTYDGTYADSTAFVFNAKTENFPSGKAIG